MGALFAHGANRQLTLRRIHTFLPQLSDFGGGLITLGLKSFVFGDELATTTIKFAESFRIQRETARGQTVTYKL